MSHCGSTSSQPQMHTRILWGFVIPEIPRAGTSGDRTGHLYFLKCSWSRILKPLNLAEKNYERITISNFPGKIDAANLKDFFSKNEGKGVKLPIPAVPKLHSRTCLEKPREGSGFHLTALLIREGVMGSHDSLRVDMGSHSGPAISHRTLVKFPNSSERRFSHIHCRGLF